jgi:transposase
MIRRVLQEGWSVTAVATSFEVSTRTVRKWLARFRRDGRAGLENRSSAPRLVANKLSAPWLAMVTRLRREYRMTGEEIALRLGLPRSTVAGHLRRLGLGRIRQPRRLPGGFESTVCIHRRPVQLGFDPDRGADRSWRQDGA